MYIGLVSLLFKEKDRKKRFFNPQWLNETSTTSTGETAHTGQKDTTTYLIPNGIFTRSLLRLTPPKEVSLDELECLLVKIKESNGFNLNNLLERLFKILKENRHMIDFESKKFHMNPLELVLSLGKIDYTMRLVGELKIDLDAKVRLKNKYLLEKIQHLTPNARKDANLLVYPSLKIRDLNS